MGALIQEIKGHDPLEEIKNAAAIRWIKTVSNDGKYGLCDYRIVHEPAKINEVITNSAMHLSSLQAV